MKLGDDTMRKFLPLVLLTLLLVVGSSCAALLPSIATFEAAPAVITAGQSTTLVWNVSGTTSISIDQGLGTVQPAGSQIVYPTATTVYTLTASNIAGTATRSIAVTVNPAPVVINFDVNPAVITSGASAALIWTVTGANTASIDEGIGSVSLTGNKLVDPTSTTTYTLTASGPGGTVTKSVVITVNAPINVEFNVEPDIVAVGQAATLHWDVTGATSVSIDQSLGQVQLIGDKVVYPYYTTIYTLTASSSCCSVSKAIALTVGNYYPYQLPFGYPYGFPRKYPYNNSYPYGPLIDIFNVSPSTIGASGNALLTWHVTGANTVIISGLGIVPSSGSATITPFVTTTYTLTASNDFNTVTGSVTVQVP
jgi:hypothetical protein